MCSLERWAYLLLLDQTQVKITGLDLTSICPTTIGFWSIEAKLLDKSVNRKISEKKISNAPLLSETFTG